MALLKIDAEGHEDFVVKSAAALLSEHRVDAILVEAKGGVSHVSNVDSHMCAAL